MFYLFTDLLLPLVAAACIGFATAWFITRSRVEAARRDAEARAAGEIAVERARLDDLEDELADLEDEAEALEEDKKRLDADTGELRALVDSKDALIEQREARIARLEAAVLKLGSAPLGNRARAGAAAVSQGVMTSANPPQARNAVDEGNAPVTVAPVTVAGAVPPDGGASSATSVGAEGAEEAAERGGSDGGHPVVKRTVARESPGQVRQAQASPVDGGPMGGAPVEGGPVADAAASAVSGVPQGQAAAALPFAATPGVAGSDADLAPRIEDEVVVHQHPPTEPELTRVAPGTSQSKVGPTPKASTSPLPQNSSVENGISVGSTGSPEPVSHTPKFERIEATPAHEAEVGSSELVDAAVNGDADSTRQLQIPVRGTEDGRAIVESAQPRSALDSGELEAVGDAIIEDHEDGGDLTGAVEIVDLRLGEKRSRRWHSRRRSARAEPVAGEAAERGSEDEPAELLQSSRPDNLELIDGIGPRTATLLRTHGVETFVDLAALSKEGALALDAKLGRFRGRMFRDDWQGQAARLAQDSNES